MLTLILGRGKTGKTTRLLEAVRECPASGMARRILIVPEQLSHQTERLLSRTCGDWISFSAEVLSFTRLASRVRSLYGGCSRETLDQAGRILTARLALSSISSRLKVFASVASRPDFLGSTVSMIDEFKSYSVTPERLLEVSGQTEGAFAQKLRELGEILGAYDAVTAQGACDPRDLLTQLRDMLTETDYPEGRWFFVDGFTDFSAQELGVLEELLRGGGNLTVTVPADRDPIPLFAPGEETVTKLIRMARASGHEVKKQFCDYVRPVSPALTYLEQNLYTYHARPFSGSSASIALYDAADPLEECRHCAAELRRRVMDGMRWRDMAVAAGDTDLYGPMLEAVCRDYGVPLYTGLRTPLTANPAVAFLLCGLDAVTEGMEPDTMMAYLRTGFAGISEDDCDALDNYVFTWSIRGSRWLTEWTEHPDGYDGRFTEETEEELRHLNALRAQAVNPLIRLSTGLKNAINTHQQIISIYRFLEDVSLFDQISDQIREMTGAGMLEQAQETTQVFNALVECLEQMVLVLGQTGQNGGELCTLLRTALDQYSLGTIPAALDAVSFGAVDGVRGTEPRLLCILGANAGSIPSISLGGSLLTERERGILIREMDVQLAPDGDGAMERQLLQLYSAVTAPREALMVSWSRSLAGEALQPSFLIGRLQALFPSVSVTSQEELRDAMTPEALAGLYFSARREGNAALSHMLKITAEDAPALLETLAAAESAAKQRSLIVPENLNRKLFGAPAILTASRLDELGNCPLSFFLNYGLKARPRREASFDAAEYGTFLHYILEKTVPELTARDLPLDPSVSEMLVRLQMEPYLETRMQNTSLLTSRQRYLFRRGGQEAGILLGEISEELSVSDFRPCGFELQFGQGKSLGPLTVQGRLGQGRLDGTVDRVDLWRSGEEDFYRIIDYKSGSKKFDYTELYGGVGMQLFLYLFALERARIPGSSGTPVPAGALYFPAKRTYFSVDEPATPEEVEKLRRSRGIRRSGLILAEDRVMEAMEHGAEGVYLPIRNGKSGPGDHAVSRNQLKALSSFIDRKMSGAVDMIYGGRFEPEPFYRGAAHDPCQWCDYADVCQKDGSFRREHYHEPVKAKEFWEMIGGETNG